MIDDRRQGAIAPAWQEDLQQARRLARRLLRLQRQHPLYLRRQNRANALLALEWVGIIAGTYLLVYGPLPWAAKAVLLVPWSIYASLALDVAIHYFNHWPPSSRPWANVALRAVGVLALTSPLEVRYHHWEHHRYNDPDDDPQLTLAHIRSAPGWRGLLRLVRYLGLEVVRSAWGYLPLSPLPPYIAELRRAKPADYWEIVATRWAVPAWILVLLVLRWRETLFLFLPATMVVALLASFLMNLTDHAPSDLRHPFRQATYLEPRTRRERLFSWVNHFTAATHLTHHLFPQVHWLHVRRLQRRLRPLYTRYEAPHSLIVNSILLGNPVALLGVLGALRREPSPAHPR
ncbi:MAG TPA: fatty acid desaturase [Thermoanaerobaculia bacterium]|nr:fatty acid desaturase [Thermoanaerobaculia bacterium]